VAEGTGRRARAPSSRSCTREAATRSSCTWPRPTRRRRRAIGGWDSTSTGRSCNGAGNGALHSRCCKHQACSDTRGRDPESAIILRVLAGRPRPVVSASNLSPASTRGFPARDRLRRRSARLVSLMTPACLAAGFAPRSRPTGHPPDDSESGAWIRDPDLHPGERSGCSTERAVRSRRRARPEDAEQVRRLPRRSAPAGPPTRQYSGFRVAGAVAPAGGGEPEDDALRGVLPACGARLGRWSAGSTAGLRALSMSLRS